MTLFLSEYSLDELIKHVASEVKRAVKEAPLNQTVVRNLLVESTNLQLQLVKALTCR